MSVALDHVDYLYPNSTNGVRHIDLSIAAGELVAVIGPSGCGKTTLLRLLAGFLTPTRGRVLIEGQDATMRPTRERELGIVFQNYALFPHMSVLENIAYPLKLRKHPRDEQKKRAQQALDMVGLTDYADQLPRQLSGGQQQRVALARALVFQPRALLLDEPLSALDASLRIEMRDEIRRLQREHQIATLHITHDQEEALSMADRIVVMAQGRILQIGTPHEIYYQPATRFVASFVGHANLWFGQIIDATHVDTPLGVLECQRTALPVGSSVSVLVRPERIVLNNETAVRPNAFQGRVERDRYLGALRRFDLIVPGGMLCIECPAMQQSNHVFIPPEAVQLIASDSSQ